MAGSLAQLIVNEGTWLPVAMSVALAATAWLFMRHRRASPARLVITAAMNLFVAVTLAVMGAGHLLAVTVKLAQGTLQGSPWLLYPIGIAVSVPSWLLVRHALRVPASSASLAAPVPSTCVPAALMYQFISPLASSQRWLYCHSLSNVG